MKEKDKGIKFETLKKPKLIRNLVILFMITFIGSAIYFKTSSAKYQTTQVIPIINTQVINKPWWTLNIYKDNEQTTIKSSGTIENSEYIFEGYEIPEGYDIGNVTCTRRDNNVPEEEIILTNESNKIKINDTNKKRGTICEVTIRELLNHKILADNKLQEGEPDFSKITCINNLNPQDTQTNFSCTDETQNGLYQGIDDYGDTYYFRGSVNNNWVKFGKNSEGQDIWWRIIRINGNGSIRLIYAGVGGASEVTQSYENEKLRGYFMIANSGIGNKPFNITLNNNAYVGYVYGEPGSETFDAEHIGTNDSDAKKAIDAWYETNLKEEEQYLDGDTGFCGDRSIPKEQPDRYNGYGFGTNATVYGAFGRLNNISDFASKGTAEPIFNCPNKEKDLYTTKESTNGNKALKYPVGLITADEAIYAGSLYYNSIDSNVPNYGHWLWTGEICWTITPILFHVNDGSDNPDRAHVYRINETGKMIWSNTWNSDPLRPVINLKANTLITSGKGTIDDPYIIAL